MINLYAGGSGCAAQCAIRLRNVLFISRRVSPGVAVGPIYIYLNVLEERIHKSSEHRVLHTQINTKVCMVFYIFVKRRELFQLSRIWYLFICTQYNSF